MDSSYFSTQSYFLFNFLLPASICFFLAIFELQAYHPNILLNVFNIFSIKKKRLHCFDVDIYLEPEVARMRRNLLWVLRIILVGILSFIWQALFSYQRNIPPNLDKSDFEINAACEAGLSCFYLQGLSDILLLHWLISGLPQLCPFNKSSTYYNQIVDTSSKGSGLRDRFKFISCLGVKAFDMFDILAVLATSYGLFKILIIFYEGSAWLYYYSRWKWTPRIMTALAISSMLFYIFGILYFPQVFIHTWFVAITYSTLPILLLLAKNLGVNLRNISKRRQENFGLILQSLPTPKKSIKEVR